MKRKSKPRHSRRTENSAKNSVRNRVRGNPEKTKPYRFQPGQSGNPGGRPKKFPVSDLLREVLAQPCPRDRAGRSWAQVLASAIFEQARSGDVRAFKEILDRVEGKAVNRVELSGIGGEEIKATVNAKLSVGDLLGAIRTIYGLNSPAPKEAEPERVH